MRLGSLLFICFFSITCLAQTFECPATIMVEKNATPLSDGWEAFVDASPHSLERIGFYSGNPGDGASLVPDRTTTEGRESRDEWRFVTTQDEIFWVACFYTNTSVFWAKPIDLKTKMCAATYKTTPSGSRMNVMRTFCD